MIKGFFLPNFTNIPVFQLLIGWGDTTLSSHVILDTGFSGDLKVSKETADKLNLPITGTETARTAEGKIIELPVALGYVDMQGKVGTVSIVISEGSHLAGIGLFTKFGYKASVDCKLRTVELERQP